MDEQLIKQITGGDRVTARFLHKEFIEFRPQFKVFLAANNIPIINGQDDGIWRRIRLIPCTWQIPEDKRIQDFDLVLLQSEREGILNRLVGGCMQWQQMGLSDPQKVKNATSDYRSDMDVLGEFIRECCGTNPDHKIKHGDLYRIYQHWCIGSGEAPCGSRILTKMLEARGFRANKPHNRRTWHGIREQKLP
jgi:putative DNA primase/helicase